VRRTDFARAFRVLTAAAGVLLLGSALVMLGYAVGAGEHLSPVGWVAVVVFGFVGALALRRAMTWNAPICCRRCGAALGRDDRTCPECGLDLEKTGWATIGSYKLP
jgi:hypothetical protein